MWNIWLRDYTTVSYINQLRRNQIHEKTIVDTILIFDKTDCIKYLKIVYRMQMRNIFHKNVFIYTYSCVYIVRVDVIYVRKLFCISRRNNK